MLKLTKAALGVGMIWIAAVSPVLAQDGPVGAGGEGGAQAGVGNGVTDRGPGVAGPGDTSQDPTSEESDKMSQAFKDFKDKKYAPATKALKEVLKESPNILEAHEMLASIYLTQQQVPQAIPELEAVVRLHPKDVADYRSNLGAAYQQTGNYPKAIALYQDAIRQNPKDPALAANYALVLEKSGRHADAAAAFEKAAALSPKDSRPLFNAGYLYHQAGNDAKAVPLLKSAIALGTPEKFNAYISLAEAASTAKQPAEAVQDYMLALQAKPDDFNAQANIGVVQQNAGNKAEAEAAYRKALTLKADTPKSRASVESNLGVLLINEGKLDDARKRFQQVADGANKDYASLAKLSLADTAFVEDRGADGEKLLKDLIESPTILVSKEQATISLARHFVTVGKVADARKLLQPLTSTPNGASQAAVQMLGDLQSQ